MTYYSVSVFIGTIEHCVNTISLYLYRLLGSLLLGVNDSGRERKGGREGVEEA